MDIRAKIHFRRPSHQRFISDTHAANLSTTFVWSLNEALYRHKPPLQTFRSASLECA